MNVGEYYNPWKLFTGIFIPESLVSLSHKILSPGAKLLFGRLALHAGKNGTCFPSHGTLADEIGVSERSVREYVKELEDGEFIRRLRDGNQHYYKFVWHQSLDESIRPEIKHRHDPAAVTNTSTGSGTGRILPTAPAGSCNAYKEEKNQLKEVKEELPLTPSSHEEPYEPSPLADPDEADLNNPEASPERRRLAVLRWLQREFRAKDGRATSDLRLEYADGVLALWDEHGEPWVRGKLAAWIDGGGRRSRDLDKFAQSLAPTQQNGSRSGSRSFRAASQGGSAPKFLREQRSPSVAQERTPPPDALRWNELVPGHCWRVWDDALDGKWQAAVTAMNGRFPEWLERCAEYSPAALKQGKFGAGFNLDKALEHWTDVFNGKHDWMLRSGEKPEEEKYVDPYQEL